MTQKSVADDNVAIFKAKLADYKGVMDEDIEAYVKHVQKVTLQQYGANARVVTDAYLELLARRAKRIRGALTMVGYEMLGGTNVAMIVQAARAIEMTNAYILIVDDIQDRSPVRRGGATVHKMLEQYHDEHHFADESAHFGIATALNAALTGNHAAQMILANMDAPEDARLKVLSVLNRTMMVTAHGQTEDIFNEVAGEPSESDVERVFEWKTANYTILNPLHVGMILAGADCEATDAITDYAMHTGKAFQITDDILGTFGQEFDSGKSPLDDIKEGKRTLLVVYALQHASNSDQLFLLQMLGNAQLSSIEFERCKQILIDSGALAYARTRAKDHVKQALTSLDNERSHWSAEGTRFLRGLAQYLLMRTS